MHLLERRLDDAEWLLADGATGTNLFEAGLQSGDAPELWNLTSPEKITKLYQASVDAGCDIFLTNTFGGNASRLELHSAQNKVLQINKVAAELAREVADKSGRDIIVAGSVGPTGDVFTPVGTMEFDTAVEIFHEQATGLLEGGVDVLWLETISAAEEFRAAAAAFALLNTPGCGTMSFDTAGRTMIGLTSMDMVNLVNSLPNRPLAFGANCGVGASDLLRTVLGFSSSDNQLPIIAKGNAGIPKYLDGHIHYDGTPELMGEYACLARDSGAKIIGGCCGTTPKHLAQMREKLEVREKKQPPSLSHIAEKLGEFSSPTDGSEPETNSTQNRLRRRGRRQKS